MESVESQITGDDVDDLFVVMYVVYCGLWWCEGKRLATVCTRRLRRHGLKLSML